MSLTILPPRIFTAVWLWQQKTGNNLSIQQKKTGYIHHDGSILWDYGITVQLCRHCHETTKREQEGTEGCIPYAAICVKGGKAWVFMLVSVWITSGRKHKALLTLGEENKA